MSLHQLVANALWKFGKRPVWLSIFPSSLQLCCVKSQTRRSVARCGNAAFPVGLFWFSVEVIHTTPWLCYWAFDCLHSRAPCNFSEVIMWRLIRIHAHVQHTSTALHLETQTCFASQLRNKTSMQWETLRCLCGSSGEGEK